MGTGGIADNQRKKLLKRLGKRFDGTPGVKEPGKGERKLAKKADATLLTYVEQGSFAHGACGGCGWEGPGRRSRAKASGDYLEHAVKCSRTP